MTDGDKLWDLQTGEQVGVVTNGGSRASSLLFSPDGALLAVESRCDIRPGGQCLRVFDTRSGEQIFETSAGWAFYDVGFPTENSLAFGASDVGFDPNNPERFSRSWFAVDLRTGTTSPAIAPGPIARQQRGRNLRIDPHGRR